MALVDAIAKRYGCTPGEVSRMSADDFALAALCVQQGQQPLIDAAEKASDAEGIGGAIMGMVVMHAALVT